MVLEERTVSRRHARLCGEASGRWTVEDAGSRYGVYVNGEAEQGWELPLGGQPVLLGVGAGATLTLPAWASARAPR